MNNQSNYVAILEGSPVGDALIESMSKQGLSPLCFNDLESIDHSVALSSISVFVFRVKRNQLGSLLIALSRMNYEFPRLRKLAVVDDQISVMLATYLSTCSVDFVNTCLDAAGVERVAMTVRQIAEQRPWCVAGTNP